MTQTAPERYVVTDLEPIMQPDPIGAWVKYEDYAALQTEIQRCRDRLDKAREVRPLEWKHREPPAEDVDNLFGEVCRANTPWDDPYIIYDDSLCDDDGVFDDGGDSIWFIGGEFYPSVEEAKAAAQAAYQRRILSALLEQGEG